MEWGCVDKDKKNKFMQDCCDLQGDDLLKAIETSIVEVKMQKVLAEFAMKGGFKDERGSLHPVGVQFTVVVSRSRSSKHASGGMEAHASAHANSVRVNKQTAP